MKKLLLLSLILFSVHTPHAWAVSQEQYDKYHTAKMNGDFGEIMEVVNHISATEDPKKLTVDDFEILSTAVTYYQQFGYVFKQEEIETFGEFLDPASVEDTTKSSISMLRGVWWMGWSDTPSEWADILNKFDVTANTDVQGGMSPHVKELINWKLVNFYIRAEDFVEAEIRLIGHIEDNKSSDILPWEAALWLSRLSYLYLNMGNSELALSTLISADQILSKLNPTPHLYLSEIVQNLSHVAALHGYFEAADFYLDLLQLQNNQPPQYRDNSAELNIATTESYIAFRTLEEDRLKKARARHNNSGWVFNEIDVDVFYDYIDGYIATMQSQDCSSQVKFDRDGIGRQSIGNVLRVLELNTSTLCGDFHQARKALKDLNVHAKESLAASYKGLSRSMQSYPHSVWTEEVILKALSRIQLNEGSLDKGLTDDAIEIFLKLESSPAERELTALSLARNTKSPNAVNELRTYFNFLREREIFVPNLVKVYTKRVLTLIDAGFPTNMVFESPGFALENRMLRTRRNIEKFLIAPVAKTSSDISQNLLNKQAAIFNIDRGNMQLSCLVSKKEQYCEVIERESDYQTVALQIVDAITKQSLMTAADDIQKLADVKFPKQIKKLAKDYEEIFYVPSSDDWNLPLNLIWAASDIPATLIITPTLSGLTHRNGPSNSNQAKYSYAGIGNPNYSVKSLAALTELQEINGFSLRSAGYINQLSQLAQLPATEEEIKASEKNFFGNTQIIIGTDANEDNLLDTDWYDSDIIHFATHALISGEMSGLEEPAIALSNPDANSYQDGLLTATDIRGYNFPSSTVILSGCRTATDYGKSSKNGVTGFSLAFLLQGAKNLIVTQWQIPDQFSAQIMSRVTSNLSVDSSASSLKDAIDSFSSKNIDPFNWAAYVYISLPSFYNDKKTQRKKSSTQGVLAGQGTSGLDISHAKIDNIDNVMVSYTLKSDATQACDIYENTQNKLKLKSKIIGYSSCYFIGSNDQRFVFLVSSLGGWIGRLDDSLSHVEDKIQVIDASNTYITNFASPVETATGFMLAYRGEVADGKGAFVSLAEIDFDLQNIIETDITNEIFSVPSPKHYRNDFSWNILSDHTGTHIAVSRSFIIPKWDDPLGSWDFPVEEISYFYHFTKNNSFKGYHQTPNTAVLSVSSGSKSRFIAYSGSQKNLALLSTKGDILEINEKISNVVKVIQFKSKKTPLIAVSTHQSYSEKSYFKILTSSLDLIPHKPIAPLQSDASFPDQIIENFQEETPYGMRQMMSDKWIHQVSIINSDDLTIEKTFPSTPIGRVPLALIIDEYNQTRIDMVNLNRLEYQQSPL